MRAVVGLDRDRDGGQVERIVVDRVDAGLRELHVIADDGEVAGGVAGQRVGERVAVGVAGGEGGDRVAGRDRFFGDRSDGGDGDARGVVVDVADVDRDAADGFIGAVAVGVGGGDVDAVADHAFGERERGAGAEHVVAAVVPGVGDGAHAVGIGEVVRGGQHFALRRGAGDGDGTGGRVVGVGDGDGKYINNAFAAVGICCNNGDVDMANITVFRCAAER